MEIGNAKAKYIFTCRVELDEDGEFVELREPSTIELREFGQDEKVNLETLIKLFPKAIVDHSFTDNGNKAKSQDVANALIESGSLYMQIIETWMESLPIKKKKKGK